VSLAGLPLSVVWYRESKKFSAALLCQPQQKLAVSPTLCFVIFLAAAQSVWLEDSLFVGVTLLLVLLPLLLPHSWLNDCACVIQVSQCWCSVPAASRLRAVQSFCQSCCPVSLAVKPWRKLPKKLARRWWWTCSTPWEASATLPWKSSCWQVIACTYEPLVIGCAHAVCLIWVPGPGHDNRGASGELLLLYQDHLCRMQWG